MLMSRYIYAIYPVDEHGKATGVYVGCTSNVERRIREHRYNRTPSCGSYKLSDDMRKGFMYQILDEIEEKDSYLEYDYIDLFCRMAIVPVLNSRIGNHADYRKALLRLIGKIEFLTL